MGEYYGGVEIDFKGSKKDVDLLRLLLTAMYKGENEYDKEYKKMPICIDDIETALFGKLDDRLGFDVFTRYFPDFDLVLAPKLIAALFPKAHFSYHIWWEYNNCVDPDVLFAEYDGKDLKICRYNEYSLRDKLLEIFAKIICRGGDWEEWLYKWEESLSGDETRLLSEMQNCLGSIGILFDALDVKKKDRNKIKCMMDLSFVMSGWWKIVEPERNSEYEKSFCENMDLENYLLFCSVRSQIMENISLNRNSLRNLTVDLIRRCVVIANEYSSLNSLPMLLDELNVRRQNEKDKDSDKKGRALGVMERAFEDNMLTKK